ncbi:MAG: DUF2254 domain-containing protein [Planctomycetota bacterium]
MKTYLLNLWDSVRGGYWFVPTLFALGAVMLSLLLPRLDAAIVAWGWRLPEWIRTTIPAARATLSAIAGAMVAVTGTVFSITIVTLSLASQQFGPRLLRSFMYDLPTQITLGVFLSTGFYCLLLLRVVEQHDGGVTAPHVSVLAAVALTVLSMAMLIVFIQNVATLIQAPHVVAAVARDLDGAIERLFPELIGDPASDEELNEASARDMESKLGENCVVVGSTREGYIQAIDADGLMQLARERDLVLRLRSRPGDFIALGSPLADVWQAAEQPAAELSGTDLAVPLSETFLVGIRRTPRQDVECMIDELVEVAVRALSPGINDPFTAMNCIDRLGAALGRVAERKLPSAYRWDDEGRLRVIARPVSFANVLDAAFNQIRQYGRDSVAVTTRLLEALESIAAHVQRSEDREALKRRAEMIVRLSESFSEEHDQRQVVKRHERVMQRLNLDRQA